MRRVLPLHQQREVQARRSAAKNRDAHGQDPDAGRSVQRGATSRRFPSLLRGTSGLVERLSVPQLARHLLVHLVEALAVVGERAPADLVAAPEPHLQEPVGIRKRLPRRADDVGRAGREDLLRLLEGVDAPGHDDRASRSRRLVSPHGCVMPARRCGRMAPPCRPGRSACTPIRCGRYTDTRPSRPSAASRPRTCRRATTTGNPCRHARTRRRNRSHRRPRCHRRCIRRSDTGANDEP